MNGCRFKNRLAVAAIALLCVPCAISQALPSAPRRSSPTVRQNPGAHQALKSIEEALPGIDLTDDQKTKIQQIRQEYKSKMEIVARDSKMDASQKGAFFEGYQRLEVRQIWLILSPVQQGEVRKKVLADQAATQAQAQKRREPEGNESGAAPNAQSLSKPQ